MPTLDLTDDEKAALVALLTAEIETSRYPLSPRVKAAKAILAKLEPAPPRPEPYAPPKPAGEPSMLLAKKKRRR